jgi:hypothetical protein
LLRYIRFAARLVRCDFLFGALGTRHRLWCAGSKIRPAPPQLRQLPPA